MRWQHVRDNWPAFFEAIQSRWPDIDEDALDEIDGDQRAFITYIAEVEQIDREEAVEQIRDWLAGEIPADVVMDPHHDNHSIMLSSKYVSDGEEEGDDDARFGDDDAVRGDGDHTGRGAG